MFCNYCGAEVRSSLRFCLNCGTKIKTVPLPEAEPAPEEEIPDPVCEAPAAQTPVPDRSLYEGFTFEYPLTPAASAEPVQAPEEPVLTVPVAAADPEAPRIQLPTGRGLGKMFFFTILTLGIYPLVIWIRIVTELNIVASRYDGERTMPYLGMVCLAPVTLCVYPLVWIHGFCRRIGAELRRRELGYRFGAKDFWLWNVLGSLILVGPFVFVYKLMKAMNLLNRDFNTNG